VTTRVHGVLPDSSRETSSGHQPKGSSFRAVEIHADDLSLCARSLLAGDRISMRFESDAAAKAIVLS